MDYKDRLCRSKLRSESPKSTLRRVARWFEPDDSAGEWFGGDGASLNSSAIYNLWREYKAGRMPGPGGWLDQRLDLLSLLEAIDYTAQVCRAVANGQLTKLSDEQLTFYRWLETD